MASPAATISERIWTGVFGAGCLAVLVIAAALEPAAEGIGTHTQLGLAPCGWHLALGYPCPTCGMTTSFTHAAHADPIGAFKAQPAGALLAVLAASLFWGSLHVVVTGSRIGQYATRMLSWKMAVFAGVALASAWAYKIGAS